MFRLSGIPGYGLLVVFLGMVLSQQVSCHSRFLHSLPVHIPVTVILFICCRSLAVRSQLVEAAETPVRIKVNNIKTTEKDAIAFKIYFLLNFTYFLLLGLPLIRKYPKSKTTGKRNILRYLF